MDGLLTLLISKRRVMLTHETTAPMMTDVVVEFVMCCFCKLLSSVELCVMALIESRFE